MTSQTSPSSTLVRTLAVLFVVALSGLTLTGCLNDDNLIGENCYDEILNNGEELGGLWRSHLRPLRSLRERGI